MEKQPFLPLIFRLGIIIGVLLATLSAGTMLFIRSSKAAETTTLAIASSPVSGTPATAYWTPERMRTTLAKSVPSEFSASLQSSTQVTGSGLGSPPSSYTQYPASVVGRIFAHDPSDNSDFSCSGSAVSSNNKSVVDTAAHCVSENGIVYTNWIFCPQYRNGVSPHGCWSASPSNMYVPSDWTEHPTAQGDFGLAVVQPLNGRTLVDTVGGAKWTYNVSSSHSVTVYGYPAAPPFDGTQMEFVSGQATGFSSADGTILNLPDVNLTPGSSGGPWFITINGTAYLNGHITSGGDNTLQSPYFNSVWYDLFQTAQNAAN
jgi:V8-like Glu-specific endopeptidase